MIQAPSLVDAHQREISYLRLSVTDRCNLRCKYCRIDDEFIPHAKVLRYEEMDRIVDLAIGFGVRKIRLTGGEPLVRKGFIPFLTALRNRHPDIDLRMTTNGLLLSDHAELLKKLGVRVNLSLDSLKRECFSKITGRDRLPAVLDSIKALLRYEVPFKINAVALKGINSPELADYINLAHEYSIDVRFIEFMPMGERTMWNNDVFWPATEIYEAASRLAELTPVVPKSSLDGPAAMFTIAGGKGRLGLITPFSNHFCGTCNRLRLTSDGRLRTCLFDDREYRLMPLLRHSKCTDETLSRVLRLATMQKPIGAKILEARSAVAVARRSMTQIGG